MNHNDSTDEGAEHEGASVEVRVLSKHDAPLEESQYKVLLEIKAVGSGKGRLGVDLVMVLDTSGSMRIDNRMEHMKSAMGLLLQKLGHTDRLSIVAYNRRATMLCPLTEITDDSRVEITNQVNALIARGSTNTEAGLRMALQIILDGRDLTKKRRAAIMLMSDGMEDVDSDAANVPINNVPVYTFGYGTDYDPKVLAAMAEKSGGTFTDVPDVEALSAAFSTSSSGFLNVIVEDLTLTTTPVNGSKFIEVDAGNYRQTKSSNADPLIVEFGALCDKETRKVLVKVILPEVSQRCDHDLLNISYEYRVAGTDKFKSDKILINVKRKPAMEEVAAVEVIVEEPRIGPKKREEKEKQTEKQSLEQAEVKQFEEDFERKRNCDFSEYMPLWVAVQKGEWENAHDYLKDHQSSMEKIFASTTSQKEISFLTDAALLDNQFAFVEEIVKLAPAKALDFRDVKSGFTILHKVAMWGSIDTVKLVVKKNPRLTQIGDIHKGNVPLLCAVQTDGQNEVLEYLYSKTTYDEPSPFSGAKGASLVIALMQRNLYGMALTILQRNPSLLTEKYVKEDPLELIAQKPSAIQNRAKLTWWERCIYSVIKMVSQGHGYDIQGDRGTKNDQENPPEPVVNNKESPPQTSTTGKGTMNNNVLVHSMRYLMPVARIKEFYNHKLMRKQEVDLVQYVIAHLRETMKDEDIKNFFSSSSILKTAIMYGTTKTALECLRSFPFLSVEDVMGEKLINMVIEERNEKIFNFICVQKARDKSRSFSMLDENKNSILHLVAKQAPNISVSGTALQMQREIQWFKGLENIMPKRERYTRNEKGETAQSLFTKEHAALMEKGEKWMKDTSGSCMLVAALIATVAFATAFTVPGGNISDNTSTRNGIPVFLYNNTFVIFAVADALALFSSITSVLMFLAVFTSRYSEIDFLKSLPQKLILGLATLFISMATILVAFGAAFTIVLGDRFKWAPIPIAIFACGPVLLFAFLQLPLFWNMVSCTYWPVSFGEQNKHRPSVSRKNKEKKN